VGHAVVAPDPLADLVVGPRLAQPRAELGHDLLLVEVGIGLAPGPHPRLARQLRVGRIVGRGGQVERQPHDRRLHDRARLEGRVQRVAREAVEPSGQGDVGRGRMLALQRREAADRVGGIDPLALEQHPARGERGSELAAAERLHSGSLRAR